MRSIAPSARRLSVALLGTARGANGPVTQSSSRLGLRHPGDGCARREASTERERQESRALSRHPANGRPRSQASPQLLSATCSARLLFDSAEATTRESSTPGARADSAGLDSRDCRERAPNPSSQGTAGNELHFSSAMMRAPWFAPWRSPPSPGRVLEPEPNRRIQAPNRAGRRDSTGPGPGASPPDSTIRYRHRRRASNRSPRSWALFRSGCLPDLGSGEGKPLGPRWTWAGIARSRKGEA